MPALFYPLTSRKMLLTQKETQCLEKVRCLVESGIHAPFSIRELIMQSGLCGSKLHSGFKFLCGKSIYQYRLLISMEYAKALLEEGMQVKEVAIRLGYSTTGSFSRAFIKVFRVPPVTYKRNGM